MKLAVRSIFSYCEIKTCYEGLLPEQISDSLTGDQDHLPSQMYPEARQVVGSRIHSEVCIIG